MTRKDYVKLAAALKESRRSIVQDFGIVNSDSVSSAIHALEIATVEIADVLARDNGRFDRERFYIAAGYGEVIRSL